MTPRLLPMLCENWARTSDRDLRAPMAIAAETDKAIGTICVKPSRYPGDARQARAFVGRLPELIA